MKKPANDKLVLDRDTQLKTIKRILKLIAPYNFFVILSILAAAVSVLGQLYIPILTGQAIDFMLTKGQVNFTGVKAIILEIILIALVSALAQWLLGDCNNRITYNVSRKLRDRAVEKIQSGSEGCILNTSRTPVQWRIYSYIIFCVSYDT